MKNAGHALRGLLENPSAAPPSHESLDSAKPLPPQATHHQTQRQQTAPRDGSGRLNEKCPWDCSSPRANGSHACSRRTEFHDRSGIAWAPLGHEKIAEGCQKARSVGCCSPLAKGPHIRFPVGLNFSITPLDS